MRKFLRYIKICFLLELKKNFEYKYSAWAIMVIAPLWTCLQIILIESIFLHTVNFAGYTREESYILFGTYELVKNFGFFALWVRLRDLLSLIRGTGNETFDQVFTKPMDLQIYATLGRFNLGNLSGIIFAIVLIFYGIRRIQIHLSLFASLQYLLVILLGCMFYYLLWFFVRTFVFWFDEFQATESLIHEVRSIGKYPRKMYAGSAGIVVNFVIPLVLMAGVPSDFLLGRIKWWMFFVYLAIVSILFFLARLFWKISLNKYSSFSS